MRRGGVVLAAGLLVLSLAAKIPLDRGSSGDSSSSKKKREQALKDQKKRKSKKVGDARIRDRGTIKLPAAVINIEDRSHMEVKRGRGVGSLIPKVDRPDFLKDRQPGDFHDRQSGKNE